jgi:hypothetical protein
VSQAATHSTSTTPLAAASKTATATKGSVAITNVTFNRLSTAGLDGLDGLVLAATLPPQALTLSISGASPAERVRIRMYCEDKADEVTYSWIATTSATGDTQVWVWDKYKYTTSPAQLGVQCTVSASPDLATTRQRQ